MKLKSRSISQSVNTWSARILSATFIGLLSALLTVNLPVIAESRSLTIASAAQSPLKFSAELSLDRGCGAVYNFGDQVVVAYSVSHDAQVQLALQRANEPEVTLVNGIARGGQRSSLALPLAPVEGARLLRLTALIGGQPLIRDCSFVARAQGAAPRQDKETDFDLTGGGKCGTGTIDDDDWVPLGNNTGQDKTVAVWNIGDCEFKVTWSDTNGQVAQKVVKPGKRTSFIGSKTLTKVIVHDCVSVSDGNCKWGAKIR